MTYGIILASGKGVRIKDNIDIPKQFRIVGNKSILIYTIENFLNAKVFDYILVVVSDEYKEYTKELLKKYNIPQNKIKIVLGGKERMDSIENAIISIERTFGIQDNDIVLIHDSVRPFITEKIILDSVEGAKKYGATVCAVPVSDTLLISEDGDTVSSIPKRSLYYKGQSPDSFNLKLFANLLSKVSEEDRKNITGTSQVCTLNNYPIHMVEGDEINFKITTKSDFAIAEGICEGSEKDV